MENYWTCSGWRGGWSFYETIFKTVLLKLMILLISLTGKETSK